MNGFAYLETWKTAPIEDLTPKAAIMSATGTETIELVSPVAMALTVQKPISGQDEGHSEVETPLVLDQPELPRLTTAIIFASIVGVTGISSLLSGLVTVILPTMARDLKLSDSVLLWYCSYIDYMIMD